MDIEVDIEVGTAGTLLELLQQQADCRPDQVAFRFCPDGGEQKTSLTYRELDDRARAIAAELQQQGAVGERVLIFCHSGLDNIAGFFGCFYAGAVAVPVDEHWPSQRAAMVIPDARAKFALSTAKTQQQLQDRVAALAEGTALRWNTLDESAADAADWVMPRVHAKTTAVLQYTSGSTGSPKGVVLTHHNYLHNLAGIRQAWNLRSDTDQPVTGVSWLPNFHDMGFVGGVLAPLYLGGTAVLMSRGAFMIRPMRWLQAISRHRAVISAAPNLGYHLCVKRSTPAERAAVDLSHWAVAVNGGDPVGAATLHDFAAAFAASGFRPAAFVPAYGLAEATLAVSGGSASPGPVVAHIDRSALGEDRVVDAVADHPETTAVVGCGRPGGGQDVAVVDPNTRRRCPADEVGEIWVAGPSVAQGYWRRPDDTERTFAATLADGGDKPFLRTGDRGFLRDGELFIVGRCQDLITVDGAHYYPNDIETTVQGCNPMLLEGRGAVFTIKPIWNATEQLVVVQEIHRHHRNDDLDGVIDAIRAAISTHHRIEAHHVLLVKPMRVPTTTSGKIQRTTCRERFLDQGLDAVARWSSVPGQRPGLDRTQVKAGMARLVGSTLMRWYWDPPTSERR